jgi:hypothetical protein
MEYTGIWGIGQNFGAGNSYTFFSGMLNLNFYLLLNE